MGELVLYISLYISLYKYRRRQSRVLVRCTQGMTLRLRNLQVGEFIFILHFQLEGDDGDVELQSVIEQQLEAGQGPGLNTQEFNDRFFL